MRPHAPLRHLQPVWFASVMGLSGLSLAWHQGVPLLGAAAEGAALVLGLLAAAAAVLLAGASLWRGLRHRGDWAEDLRHPVRHPFVATIPVALLLLSTVAVALQGPPVLARALWTTGALALGVLTAWVVLRGWRAARGRAPWAAVTPMLLIPAVGHVLVPLAGVPLGHRGWSLWQFSAGALLWPAVLALLLLRLRRAGPWPDRLKPGIFILVAPPAAIGLALAPLGAPAPALWAAWAAALAMLALAARQARAVVSRPFSVAHWALSFPLAALAALTLHLATHHGLPLPPAMALLALASLVVAALLLGTVRGLRDGSLLAPEPVATLQAAAAP